jgi:hypothetical protein
MEARKQRAAPGYIREPLHRSNRRAQNKHTGAPGHRGLPELRGAPDIGEHRTHGYRTKDTGEHRKHGHRTKDKGEHRKK